MRRLRDPALDPRGGRPRVRPLRAIGHNATFLQYRGLQGPKWTITCGACGGTFTGHPSRTSSRATSGTYAVSGDTLTFTRDDSIGIGPRPFLVKPWTRVQ